MIFTEMVTKVRMRVLACACLMAASAADAATVSMSPDTLLFNENSLCGNVEIVFSKCMANELYTFMSVAIDGKVLNRTKSDNIGPFVSNGWFMGGNHVSETGEKSAKTKGYRVWLDGMELAPGVTVEGKVLKVTVVNEIIYSDGRTFCEETIDYSVSGNSIEVNARHDYIYPSMLNIDRYYGMQSMFIGETEILTPGGPDPRWQPLLVTNEGNEVTIIKREAPGFCTFVEHSPAGYQASYMFREGLGKRDWVCDDDIVFIGNSWGKCYHKTIGNFDLASGLTSTWHGLYSWFKEPVADNCRCDGDDMSFSYIAYMGGRPMLMHVCASGEMEITETCTGK